MRLVAIASGSEPRDSKVCRSALKELNYLLKRDESKLPSSQGTWNRSYILERIHHRLIENPQELKRMLELATTGEFKPYARFKLQEMGNKSKIGYGGGGTVWKVTSTAGISYALKESNAIIDEISKQEIRREVAILVSVSFSFSSSFAPDSIHKHSILYSLCSHPRLIRCHGAMLKRDNFCYLMDLAEVDLRCLLDRKGSLTDQQRWSVAYQVAEAISFMHKCNLIHRGIELVNTLSKMILYHMYLIPI